MNCNLTRFASFILTAVFQVCRFTVIGGNDFLVNAEHDKALYGHSLYNISAQTTLETCLANCLANCLCRSFQICANNECQLCSSNKYLTPSALRTARDCTNYEFESYEEIQDGNKHCDTGCMTAINCCLTSNPCINGGRCLPISSKNKRFICECPAGYEGTHCEILICEPGYTGQYCKQEIRSCRAYSNGTRIPARYIILDNKNHPYHVFCDFDSISSKSWTLIQSYKLDDHLIRPVPLHVDAPLHQNHPSWSEYRLSRPSMTSIQRDSTDWRITCQYDTDGLLYTDYVRALNAAVDILSFHGDGCVKVEHINIRGHSCGRCSGRMVQTHEKPLHFTLPLLQSCDFEPPGSEKCMSLDVKIFEDNFGNYACVNDQHRCSSTNNSTTQVWFGGE